MQVMTLCKMAIAATFFTLTTYSLTAYEIKHGYSVTVGMEYYGVCNNGEDLKVIENFKAGEATYSGPKGKGKVKGGMDEAARKACGESKPTLKTKK